MPSKSHGWLTRTPKRFAAIDFETADHGRDSACAVAIVTVEDGEIAERWTTLIRPPRPNIVFSWLHHITWEMVVDSPTFPEIWPEMAKRFRNIEFLAAHYATFDRNVILACCAKAGVAAPELPYRCTVQLARKVWKLRPTKLPNVCRHLGIPLRHHEALSDAEACARIVVAAFRDYQQQLATPSHEVNAKQS